MSLYFLIVLLEGEILPCYPRLIKIQILDLSKQHLSVTLPVESGLCEFFHHFNKCCQKHPTLIFLNPKDLNSFNVFEETVSVASKEHSLFVFLQSNLILHRMSILFSNCTIYFIYFKLSNSSDVHSRTQWLLVLNQFKILPL